MAPTELTRSFSWLLCLLAVTATSACGDDSSDAGQNSVDAGSGGAAGSGAAGSGGTAGSSGADSGTAGTGATDAGAAGSGAAGSGGADSGADAAPTDASTTGTWPSLSEPWGHAHPSCLVDYGKTPKQIEATPCTTSSVAGGTTLSACSIKGILDLVGSGDDVTLDCVFLHSESATSTLTRCGGSGGCANFRFLRSTCRGWGSAGAGKCIGLGSHGGQSFTSVKIERSDIFRNEVPLFVQLGAGNPLPGESAHLLVQDTRIHNITNGPSFHTDGVFVAGVGVHRFVRSAVYVSDAEGNVGSTFQAQAGGPGSGSIVWENSFFESDNSGHMFNFDRSAGAFCFALHASNNVWDITGGTLFNTSSTPPKDCPGFAARPGGHTCDGNTNLSGTPLKCTGSGS